MLGAWNDGGIGLWVVRGGGRGRGIGGKGTAGLSEERGGGSGVEEEERVLFATTTTVVSE